MRKHGLRSIGGLPDFFDPDTHPNLDPNYFWLSKKLQRSTWFRAQARHRISCLRASLLDYTPYVNLETNVESGGFQVRVKRLSSKKVVVKVPDFRLTLQMKISTSRAIEIETESVPEWDDSDLDEFW